MKKKSLFTVVTISLVFMSLSLTAHAGDDHDYFEKEHKWKEKKDHYNQHAPFDGRLIVLLAAGVGFILIKAFDARRKALIKASKEV